MAVLVTGGAGYIGSHTAVELLNLGYEVVIVDNFYNSKYEAIKRIEKITNKKVKFYEADVAVRSELEPAFKENNIESVIHFAGYKAVGESVQKPLMYYRNNLDSTLTLLEVMKAYDVKDIVFSSSATVYGVDNESPLLEDMPALTSASPYGYCKVVIERILQDVVVADPTWSVTLLRYFNPIGAHESGMIGEDPQGVPNNLMPYITQVAVGKRDKLSVFGDDYDTPDGTCIRDYIHVVDLALGHIKAIEKNKKEQGVKIYNLGTGIGCSVLELVHTFQEVNDVEVPYEITDRRPGDAAVVYADVSKAEEELGWKAERDIAKMCEDSWRWQSLNPSGYDVE